RRRCNWLSCRAVIMGEKVPEGVPPGSTMKNIVLVEARDVTKSFTGVVANDKVSIEIRAGEIHALLGENGAGKSTLASILTGLYSADSGEVRIRGEKVVFHSPRDALARGIGII